ncbi:hypothetical protein PAXRUDRAFT_36179 [Paxillus rubicundulus Ve08.2h10]|uniref:Uncharacterized protein n=1 Tax=Paxillus rubicundulus Ve08.2h10 TaxID=930991 RepID=A0A0D0CCI4_9AGAM|nr:hypothetical protein PAXRUDRAFT_36179 [Paxillus rubicundulus Ve08.2h10]
MDKDWTTLCSGLGFEGFYIAVHGGVEDLSGPKLFFPEKAKNLEEILHENKVTEKACMNYSNHECKVVKHYSIELVSWPADLLPICNPGRIGPCHQVQKLFDALATKACFWKMLSMDELRQRIAYNCEHQAHGAQVYKLHKKLTIQDTAKSAETIHDGDSSHSDNNGTGVDRADGGTI